MDDRLIPLMSTSYYLKNWMFRQPVERSWMTRTFAPLGPGCLRAAIMVLCSSTIGAGMLALPYSLSTCGLALGVLLLLVVSLSFIGYYRILVRVSTGFDSHSYLQVVEAYYGTEWKTAVELFVLLFCSGMVAALETMLCELGLVLFPEAISPTTQGRRFLFLTLLSVVVLYPLCRFPQLTSLRYVSILPLASITCVMLLALCDLDSIHWDHMVWEYKLDISVCEAICIMYFSFDASINIPSIHNELSKPSFKRMEKVIFRGLFLITLIYLLFSTLGYATTANSVPVIFVLQRKDNWSIRLSQVLVGLNVILEIPLMIHPVRLCMEQIFMREDGSFGLLGRFALLPLLGLPVLAATFLPNTLLYFKVLGATFTVTTGFIIPSNTHLALLFLKFSNSIVKKVGLFLWTSLLTTPACVCLVHIYQQHIAALP